MKKRGSFSLREGGKKEAMQSHLKQAKGRLSKRKEEKACVGAMLRRNNGVGKGKEKWRMP